MIAPTSSTRKRLKKAWPKLRFIMLTDPFFYRPSLVEFQEQLNLFDPGEFIPNFRACEETAFEFMMQTRKLWPPSGEAANWAVGVAFTLECKITKDRHYLNLADLREGLFLADARTKETWRPTNEDKNIWLVM